MTTLYLVMIAEYSSTRPLGLYDDQALAETVCKTYQGSGLAEIIPMIVNEFETQLRAGMRQYYVTFNTHGDCRAWDIESPHETDEPDESWTVYLPFSDAYNGNSEGCTHVWAPSVDDAKAVARDRRQQWRSNMIPCEPCPATDTFQASALHSRDVDPAAPHICLHREGHIGMHLCLCGYSWRIR